MNIFLEKREEPLFLTDKEIFTKMWTSPRMIFKYINETNYNKYSTLLLILAGINRAFDRASVKNFGDKTPLWEIIGLSVFIGGLLGWIYFYIYSALVSWTGKLLKGKGNTSSIFHIISYAMTPSILTLILLIPQIGIYGNEMFKSNGDITSAGLIPNILFYSSMFLEFILGFCTVVFCVIGISEVQKLSIGKSILNLLLPVLIFLFVILVFISIF